MKKQLVLTITEELIPAWKDEAKSLNLSLSDLIEKRMSVQSTQKPKFGDAVKQFKDKFPEKSFEQTKDEYLMEKYK